MKEKTEVKIMKNKEEKEFYLSNDTSGMKETLYKIFKGWRITIGRPYPLLKQGKQNV